MFGYLTCEISLILFLYYLIISTDGMKSSSDEHESEFEFD